ncbi:hypothetical protein MNR02_06470 [Shinella sp. H4-D48]|uniref:hypothetical protein n=1 Tax=Shinella sp. H4-D48 TaxID=2925841 RepID=UPI001F52C42E|nr:hypothetical protein [Shinella sp. H4-D48]UNK39345.1 hypothetical protein MNR02_06470 [Shinella sp. H4-D48]
MADRHNVALGNGWYATLTVGVHNEMLTLRNPDKGQRIDLDDESVKLLREIFHSVSSKVA